MATITSILRSLNTKTPITSPTSLSSSSFRSSSFSAASCRGKQRLLGFQRRISAAESPSKKSGAARTWLEIAMVVGVVGFVGSTGQAMGIELDPSWLSREPGNALSLPTWAIHVSSVVEWITAMALVWQYGEKSGYTSWKGLSWGMVPPLGSAMCACTWHFFYNAESLEVLVALQAALTVIGNSTMCVAAYYIYKSTERESKTK